MSKETYYRIVWQSAITGKGGQGEAVFITEDAAQAHADSLNAKYPHIKHRVKPKKD